ncbi:WD repeat-containing protein 97-like isoform X2 [Littorina saxatilis]|uniref:WD repeat-containing protein 97 n=1 Tax=Littorina saxatilis TaxID=31220 RepID=A0AAN9C095_9CAEN
MALAHLISDVRTTDIPFKDENVEEGSTGRNVTELELLGLRRRAEDRKKAQRNWELLRDSITNVRKAVEQSDNRNVSLVHGIHHDRKLNHSYPIRHAIFIPHKKEYLTSDGETVWLFHQDGRKKEMVTPEEQLDRIIFASQTNQFVGWREKEETLYLMSELFEIISQAQAVGGIHLGVYNNNTGEMITVGPGFITSWAFRYGARHLIPRKTTVTEFDEGNMFSIMVLEETASRSQRMFFALTNGVVVYNVYQGKMLEHHKELHVRPISAITFFNPLKYLITGAMDGCIKVWDSDWCVKMVFVGHSGLVNALAIYPHGPLFISAARDCTVRVWSMETCDEVDKTSIAEPVQGLYTSPRYDVFFTFAGKKVDLWRLNHLYHIHTNIGHRVNTIKLTTHPFHPVRAVLMCRDSSVRIISPPTGAVITTMILPPATGLMDAAYAIAENRMFTVCRNGDIIKCRTDVNPCEIMACWRCSSLKEVCNYLLVYEYVVDVAAEGKIGQMMKSNVATKSTGAGTRNRTLLLGGRKDGYICVYNWDTGDVDFKVEAHGSKSVLNLIANSKLDQLISAGLDNIIKVWRLYPFAEEALAPLMSFYCAHTPAYMSTIKSSLCVAFQDPSTATFSIVIYNLPEKNRHDHKPDDDHVDMITGLTSCARMKLFASSSMDGTIHIWNEENKLVRVLRLNAMPNSIGFCSPRGDLLVGIGLHLFHIPWHRYLPKPYLHKMVSMRFIEPRIELAIPYEEERLVQMDKNDVKRLKVSHASFKVTHFEDELSQEEQDLVMRKTRIREKAFAEIEMRENELGLIRDGGKTAARKAPATKRTQREAMKNYMKLFYNKERIQIPLDDPYPLDSLKEKLDAEAGDEEKYRPETVPVTFFQEILRNRTPGSSSHGMSPIGFVPNSVLVKIMYPPPTPAPDPATLRPYRPPELSAKQLEEIKALKKEPSLARRSVTFNDREESFDLSKRTLELDLDEDEENVVLSESEAEKSAREDTELSEREKTEEEMKSATPAQDMEGAEKSTPPAVPSTTPLGFLPPPPLPKPKKKTPIQEEDEEDDEEDAFWGGKPKSSEQSNLMNKFKGIMDKPPSPKPEEIEAEASAVALAAVSPDQEEKPKPASREMQQPTKPVTKLVSRPRRKLLTPTPPPSPTPPPPPSPLPDFIQQFIGTEWFEKYFPNCNETEKRRQQMRWEQIGDHCDVTMPKPWGGDNFVNMVMKLLRFASFPHKTAVAEAIMLVHAQEVLSEGTCHAAQKMLLSSLNHHTHTPSCAEPEQKAFILTAIKALQAMGICDKEFVLEMLVQFLDGDRDVRTTVLDILNSIGLQDPHRQMQKELDSWDIWNIEDADRKKELKMMCSQWLERWMTSYKLHIKDAVERLHKGQNLHGRLRRGSMAHRGSIVPGSRRGSMMPDSDLSLGGAGDHRPSTRGSMTLTIDKPDLALAEHATYLEAMTYFCEMMMEKELESLRRGEVLRRGQQDEPTTQGAKNTVLVLPKIAHKPALVRLGETHTSKCRLSRETAFSVDYHQINMLGKGKQPAPGQLTGFVPCINLPMKPVYLNPFPSPIDALDQRFSEPILITLKTSQKYFIPATSVVPREMQVAPSS